MKRHSVVVVVVVVNKCARWQIVILIFHRIYILREISTIKKQCDRTGAHKPWGLLMVFNMMMVAMAVVEMVEDYK